MTLQINLNADMAEYTALTRQLFFKSNNVRRFKSLVCMDSAKVTLNVPIRHADAPASPDRRQ